MSEQTPDARRHLPLLAAGLVAVIGTILSLVFFKMSQQREADLLNSRFQVHAQHRHRAVRTHSAQPARASEPSLCGPEPVHRRLERSLRKSRRFGWRIVNICWVCAGFPRFQLTNWPNTKNSRAKTAWSITAFIGQATIRGPQRASRDAISSSVLTLPSRSSLPSRLQATVRHLVLICKAFPNSLRLPNIRWRLVVRQRRVHSSGPTTVEQNR